MFNELLNLQVLGHIICNWWLIDYLLGQLQVMWLSLSINHNLWFRSISISIYVLSKIYLMKTQVSKSILSSKSAEILRFCESSGPSWEVSDICESSGHPSEVPDCVSLKPLELIHTSLF